MLWFHTVPATLPKQDYPSNWAAQLRWPACEPMGFKTINKYSISISNQYLYWLVVSTPLKNMKVTWDDYSQYMEKLKNKRPTSIDIGRGVPLCNFTKNWRIPYTLQL
jgi:hypothetical protein